MKYIVVSGGLGNQMFQYAFYRSMLHHGVSCVLNTDMYNVVKMHNGCELHKVFGIESDCKSNFLSVISTRFFYKYKISPFVYKEKKYIYDQSVYKSKATYFIGNWINELYFTDLSSDLRKIFIFKNIDEDNMNLSKMLSSQNSVSIHIRRGDYLKIPNWNVCDNEYYAKAIKYIKNQIVDPFFYVFSDDPDWCVSFLNSFDISYKIVSTNRGDSSYKDMFLMSKCKHNINANSTFSWWGSWLNPNPRKIVIMPKIWTKDTLENPACSTWIKL